jgi:hypothetical protein
MSHTIHWSNQAKEHILPNYGTKRAKCFKRIVSYDYRDRLGNPSSMLGLQADVLYPNALAAVVAQGDSLLPSPDERNAVGCTGNQLDRKFPFEPRVPVALPLIQYPTPTRNKLVAEEHDACAQPVLNWEKYIQDLHYSIKGINVLKPVG